MDIKQVVQSSANIIQITRLNKGDTVKMIETKHYSTPQLSFGVVVDVLNSGDGCFIELLKFSKAYDTVKGEYVIIGGEDNEGLTLFPAKPEEVKEHLSGVIDSIKDSIKSDEESLQKKKHNLDKAISFVSGEMSGALSLPQYKVQEIESTQKLT